MVVLIRARLRGFHLRNERNRGGLGGTIDRDSCWLCNVEGSRLRRFSDLYPSGSEEVCVLFMLADGFEGVCGRVQGSGCWNNLGFMFVFVVDTCVVDEGVRFVPFGTWVCCDEVGGQGSSSCG